MFFEIPMLFAAGDITSLIFPLIIAAVFYALKYFGNRNAAESETQPDEEDAGERMRRIREEVARRTAEKTKPPTRQISSPAPAKILRVPPPIPVPAAPEASIRDRQNALLEELENAKKSVLASQRRVEALLNAGAGKPANEFETITSAAAGKTPALAFLKNKDALRTSIVVREILSPPLSLRQ